MKVFSIVHGFGHHPCCHRCDLDPLGGCGLLTVPLGVMSLTWGLCGGSAWSRRADGFHYEGL